MILFGIISWELLFFEGKAPELWSSMHDLWPMLLPSGCLLDMLLISSGRKIKYKGS